MSGGSLDYFCFKVDEVAEKIEERTEDPLKIAFAEHLRAVSTALHDIEWEFSGDYGSGDSEEAIRKVLGENADEKVSKILNKEAEKLIERLKKYS